MTETNPLSTDADAPGRTYDGGHLHGVFGLPQYWSSLNDPAEGYYKFKITWSGKARGDLEQLAIEKFEANHPDGCAVRPLGRNKTNVPVWYEPEAKALYSLLTEMLHKQSISGHARNTYHRVRDELVEKCHLDKDALKEGASVEDFDRPRELQRERHEEHGIASFVEDAFEYHETFRQE